MFVESTEAIKDLRTEARVWPSLLRDLRPNETLLSRNTLDLLTLLYWLRRAETTLLSVSSAPLATSSSRS